MDTERAGFYLPWADDALVYGESPFALLHKLAWFSVRGPWKLIQELKASEAMPSRPLPSMIEFRAGHDVWKRISVFPQLPRFHGLRLSEYIDKASLDSRCGLSSHRPNHLLRYCPDCISVGMHFGVAQLELIECCPHHGKRFISHCNECGDEVRNACISYQEAFACESCNASFLRPELTDIRANLSDRRQASLAHARLVKRVSEAPSLLRYSHTRYLIDGLSETGFRHAMRRMVDNRKRGGPSPTSSISAPYYPAKVERDEQGRTRIKRLSKINLTPEEPAILLQDERSERRLAQLRVGAWALNHFRNHIVCICAARELMKDPLCRQEEFTADREPQVCCIGRGFATWEAAWLRQSHDETSPKLPRSWGLHDGSVRSVAFYIMEKARLSSAIMLFVESNPYVLREWARNKFDLEIVSSKVFDARCDEALLCVDINRMGFDDFCDLHFRKPSVQQQWLGEVVNRVSSLATVACIRSIASSLPREALGLYGAAARQETGGKLMHEAINRRVQFTLESRNSTA